MAVELQNSLGFLPSPPRRETGMNTPVVSNEPWRRKRTGIEAPRNSFDLHSPSARWIAAGFEDIPFSVEVSPCRDSEKPPKPTETKTPRKPNVVARLMGLETFPAETSVSANLCEASKTGAPVPGDGSGVGLGTRLTEARDSTRTEVEKHSSEDSFLCFLRGSYSEEGSPSRIIVLKPRTGKTESVGGAVMSDRQSQTKTVYPPEKVLHAVAETKTRQETSSARDLVNLKFSQELSMQARDSADKLTQQLSVHSAERPEHRAAPPTLKRYINLHRGLETLTPPASPPDAAPGKQRRETFPAAEKEAPADDVETPEQPSPASVLEFRESPSPPGRQNDAVFGEDGSSARLLDFESRCSNSKGLGFLACKDVQRADMMYVWRVICYLAADWRAGSRIGRRVFQRLEADCQGTSGSLLHRRLLFDTVVEIVSRRLKTANVSRQGVMQEVWREVADMKTVTNDTLESSCRRDVCSGVFWSGLDEEVECLKAEITRVIINSLVDEAARELVQKP